MSPHPREMVCWFGLRFHPGTQLNLHEVKSLALLWCFLCLLYITEEPCNKFGYFPDFDYSNLHYVTFCFTPLSKYLTRKFLKSTMQLSLSQPSQGIFPPLWKIDTALSVAITQATRG